MSLEEAEEQYVLKENTPILSKWISKNKEELIMKTNTNITYKEFKNTNIFKSAVIIEFTNANGQSSFDDISDEALESMIVKDYNYESGYLEIVLREEESNIKNLEIKLYNAIVLIAENENYKLVADRIIRLP